MTRPYRKKNNILYLERLRSIILFIINAFLTYHFVVVVAEYRREMRGGHTRVNT